MILTQVICNVTTTTKVLVTLTMHNSETIQWQLLVSWKHKRKLLQCTCILFYWDVKLTYLLFNMNHSWDFFLCGLHVLSCRVLNTAQGSCTCTEMWFSHWEERWVTVTAKLFPSWIVFLRDLHFFHVSLHRSLPCFTPLSYIIFPRMCQSQHLVSRAVLDKFIQR